MPQSVNEQRMAIVLELTKQGANPIQVTCRADYEKSCTNCGEVKSKSVIVTLTPAQETAIKNFATQVKAVLDANP